MVALLLLFQLYATPRLRATNLKPILETLHRRFREKFYDRKEEKTTLQRTAPLAGKPLPTQGIHYGRYRHVLPGHVFTLRRNASLDRSASSQYNHLP
jgi:hypothetical protein